MILIADSGSTSTDWRFVDEHGKIEQFKTKGINPFHDSQENITQLLLNDLPTFNPSRVYFYGAGCTNNEVQDIIRKVFKHAYKDAQIEVNSDILAAARALCNREAGIVCILGTGANACYYDGDKIHGQVPALGYILGDEGSGTWLGKRLIHDYFGKSMDSDCRKLFEQFGNSSKDYIIEQVYGSEKPAAFIASYTTLISENLNQPYFYQLVYDGFKLFIDDVVKRHERHSELPIHFAGSIAFVFGNILRQAMKDSGLYVKNIVQSPIAGLTLFHLNSLK